MVDKEGLEGVRAEFKKVVAGIRGEGLELKERIVGLGRFFEKLVFANIYLEKDVVALTRNARTQLQPQS